MYRGIFYPEIRIYDDGQHIWMRNGFWKGYKTGEGWKSFKRSPERTAKLRAWLALRCYGMKYDKDNSYGRNSAYVQFRNRSYVEYR